jgi:hypothetical protein
VCVGLHNVGAGRIEVHVGSVRHRVVARAQVERASPVPSVCLAGATAAAGSAVALGGAAGFGAARLRAAALPPPPPPPLWADTFGAALDWACFWTRLPVFVVAARALSAVRFAASAASSARELAAARVSTRGRRSGQRPPARRGPLRPSAWRHRPSSPRPGRSRAQGLEGSCLRCAPPAVCGVFKLERCVRRGSCRRKERLADLGQVPRS